MKRWMILSMIAFGFLVMSSCRPTNRVVQGGAYGYYDPMYYGPRGYYYNPNIYPRTNVIIQEYRKQPRNRIVAPRSNRRPATVAPENRRGDRNDRPAVQPQRPQTAPSQKYRRPTTPGRRENVAPARKPSPAPAQRSVPNRSRSRGNN